MLANLDWKLIRDFWEFKNEVNEKSMNANKISSKNYFKDFEDNLLINLHKVNMRRNISQEDTKRTEKSLD